MSFNRLRYDDGAYRHDLRQSVGQHDYVCNTPQESPVGPCVAARAVGKSTTGLYAGKASAWPELVAVESELSGITRKISNDPNNKYMPSCGVQGIPPPMVDTCGRDVGSHLDHEDTRLSNPAMTLRGTGWNRFEWLPENPQMYAITPFDTNISNRIVAKDNHRPMLQIPEDQTKVLPPQVYPSIQNDTSCGISEWNHEPSTAWKPWNGWCSTDCNSSAL